MCDDNIICQLNYVIVSKVTDVTEQNFKNIRYNKSRADIFLIIAVHLHVLEVPT